MRITYGDESAVEELMYGRQSDRNINFLRSQIGQFTAPLLDIGAAFMQRSAEVFEQVSGSEVLRKARRALAGIGGFFSANEISALDNLLHLQLAKPMMQRFNMAEPETRRMYHAQRIEGYGESYVDLQPGRIGRDHYDYRLATHGIVQPDAETATTWSVTQYREELRHEEDELTAIKRLDIQRSWSSLKSAFVLGGEDPTSKFGAML